MKRLLSIAVMLIATWLEGEGADGPASEPALAPAVADAAPTVHDTTGTDCKTPAQWLVVIKAENELAKQYEAAHPEEAKLLLGGCWRGCPTDKFPQTYQDAIAAYADWWKSTGEHQFNQWRHDGFPFMADLHHQFLVAEAFLRRKEGKDIEDYTLHVAKRGKELVLKGCSGLLLSRNELDELRCFAVYQCYFYEDEIMTPGNQGWMKTGVSPGDPAPDFTLPRLEEVLKSPAYTDQDPNDRRNEFRPIILTELLQIMDGYEATTNPQPGSLVRAKPYKTPFKNAVTLSSFRGKKPVLFMCMDATDSWCWCGTVCGFWGPLYSAIKDKVEVFFIHTTVHDEFMWAGAPWGLGPQPLSWAYHPLSVEARARTAKICYMAYSTLSIPYLLDDQAYHLQNAYQGDGGGAETFLVDKQGTVSLPIDFSLKNMEIMNYVAHSQYGSEDEPSTRSPRLMSLIECNVKALLDAGGIWSPALKPVVPDWTVPPLVSDVQIAAVDATAGSLTVTGKDGKPLVLAVDALTRLVQSGKRLSLSDLKPGEVVGVEYQADTSQSCGKMARIVMVGSHWTDIWDSGGIWIPSTVLAINPDRHVVTVRMTLDVASCKGPGFWKSATPALFDKSDLTNDSDPFGNRPILAKQNQVFTLHTDRATEFILNGMTSRMSDLKIGDQIGIDVPNNVSPDDVWPHFIRIYRF